VKHTGHKERQKWRTHVFCAPSLRPNDFLCVQSAIGNMVPMANGPNGLKNFGVLLSVRDTKMINGTNTR